MTSKSTSYHAQALSRGLDILRRLARSSRKQESLAQLHEDTGLPKSTLIRLLTVLEQSGFVLRVDEVPNFRIGHAVMDLAEGYRRSSDIGALASPHLKRLADATNQTANLGVIDDASVVHLCVQEPNRALRFRSQTGSRDALHCTSLGKMLLAGMDGELALELLLKGDLDKRTENTLSQPEDIMAEVARSRVRGFAIEDEESDRGVYCVAVPLTGQPVKRPWHACISLSGPAGEMKEPHRDGMVEALRTTAEAMSEDAELKGALSVYAQH